MQIPLGTYNIKQTAMLMLCGLLPILSQAQQRSEFDVIKIASEFCNSKIYQNDITDMRLLKKSSSISSERIQEGREVYYIYSTNKKGFVVVSGDKRMPAVLAYSDENYFDVDNIPPNVRYWLDCYVEAFQLLDHKGETYSSLDKVDIKKEVAPLILNNKWGQDSPFNRSCPSFRAENCLTGCVATAMSQVMQYHKYPLIGKGDISYTTNTNNIRVQHDFSSVQFNWNDMLYDYSEKYNSTQADAVAELMYSCGASVKMDYCTSAQGGSGAYMEDVIPAYINNFSYDEDAAFMVRTNCSTDDWHSLLMKELNENRPVNYAGVGNIDGGHAFVIDGYRFSEDNKYPDYHINWGWNGVCNGYYQIANLHPAEKGQHASMSGFNSNQRMCIGIKPEDNVDDGVFYLSTSRLHVSSSDVEANSTVQVYTSSCINLSYNEFNGTLHVVLIPADGSEEIIVGESNIRSLSFLQEKKNVSIEFSLPSDLQEGQYQVLLISKQSGKDNYNKVYSPQYPTVEVLDNGNIIPPLQEEYNAMLGCSEIELDKNVDSLIRINIYELVNLQESPFIGDLRMILTNKQGEMLCAFGDSIQPGELSMLEIQNYPQTIQGVLTGDWPDGDYKLFIGAKLINTTEYYYISFYDIAKPNMNYQELCFNVKINDGKLIIDNMSYEILTSIGQVKKQCDDYMKRFNSNGMQITSQGLHRGINIIHSPKGVVKKYIIK